VKLSGLILGTYLALGQMNGHISIRDKAGNEKVRIERSQPIWTIQFAPPLVTNNSAGTSANNEGNILAVGCWDQTLSFYDLSGNQVNKDRQLNFDPASISYYCDGEYILIGGSNRKVGMYTRDGVFLKLVAEKDDWVWTVKARPKHKFLALGCNDGQISMISTVFSTVHGLYQDRYAHRDTMTDVIIQHLITEQKVRIKTRDYVKKIAVYKARLAVQLPDRVLIYKTINDEPYDMHYELKEKIIKQLDCNLLVVTSAHIILCQEKKLQLYNFNGRKVREWVLEAIIRYIRVVGGPPGREGLLIGLKNGCVYKIFIDNRFPVKLIQHVAPIRCLDLSSSRNKLAVVDENSKVYIYDLLTQQVLFEENNANSVAWNTDMEDMFCYSGGGQLCIKTGDFPIHKQALQGFVVGFKGSKIFCLHFLSMQTIDVPQSASLFRYLEQRDYEHAYQVACLGVTDSDWRELAIQSLQGLAFEIARKAFIRIRDVRYIELLNRIESSRRSPSSDDNIYLADIAAFQGNFNEAARLYIKSGQRKRAIEMYLDLRDWDAAKRIVEELSAAEAESRDAESGLSMAELLKRQANWLQEVGDTKAAAEMYWAAKEFNIAITLLGDNQWLDLLIEKVRSLNKSQHLKQLQAAANYFRKFHQHQYAKETFLKMDDIESLVELHVELHHWDEAFQLVKGRPQHVATIYEPYAEWLALNDRFDEAQHAFKLAGKPEQSTKMLSQLTLNAITENRYSDAGYYYWLLAAETLKNLHAAKQLEQKKGAAVVKSLINKFHEYYTKSEIYYSYHNIYRYTDEPFTSLLADALFQISQFILNQTKSAAPHGVSKVYTLFALAKQGKQLGAFKLARQAYQRLLTLKIPNSWRDQIEMSSLTIRTKPLNDKEELLPVCYRCSTSNPLLSNAGDSCVNCGHPFIRSFCSFEQLPLVQFTLAPGITDEEAKKLIQAEPMSGKRQNGATGSDVMTFDGEEAAEEDKFHALLMQLEPNAEGTYDDIVVDKDILQSLKSEEVFIRSWPNQSLPTQYYRTVIPDLPIVLCSTCNHFFHEEDYEFHVLQKNQCPFCRAAVNKHSEEADELLPN
jgi:intraflagellar transport protein 122